VASLTGHLAPYIGSSAERDVKKLLEALGYSILRENVIHPNIDKVIKFIGIPKPEPQNQCFLQKPIFSPPSEDIIAVSIKQRDIRISDIKQLLEDIEEAKLCEDPTLHNISSGLIITNFTKLPSEINRYFEMGIYCWDLRRLFFYASKINRLRHMSSIGPVREFIIDSPSLNIKASYLRLLNPSYESKNTIVGKFVIFIDEHDSEFIYSADHHTEVLEYIYSKEIKPMIEQRDFNVYSQFEVHVLGKAAPELIRNSYIEFSRRYLRSNEKGIGALFAADIPIYQYGVSPWSILI